MHTHEPAPNKSASYFLSEDPGKRKAMAEKQGELADDLRQSVQKWIDDSKSLSILFTGKTGVGKSSLANALVGKEVSPEGVSLDPETLEVSCFNASIAGVDVTIWDSPGLQDRTSNEVQYLENIAMKCKELDLVLYCSRMDDSRIREEDFKAITTLTKAFGDEIWVKSVFTLTFANYVKQAVRGRRAISPPDQKEYFLGRLSQWTAKLREAVEKSGVAHEIASNIPVVPVGYQDNFCLPDRENWLGDFWLTCLKRINDRAKPALIKINVTRLKAAIDGDSSSLTGAHETPIDVSSNSINDEEIIADTLLAGTYGILLGGILGIPAGPVGVAIGVALGAVSFTAVTGANLVAEDLKRKRTVQQRSHSEPENDS